MNVTYEQIGAMVMSNLRRNQIIEELTKNEKVEIDDLASKFQVSAMTIRRDLALLEEQEKVVRTTGGAILKKNLVSESSIYVKDEKFKNQKKKIAELAIQMISDGTTILLDSGTTTFEIAQSLNHFKNITVITNDIRIAASLLDTNVRVIVTGGELQNSVGALFGPLTEHMLQEIHVDLFFLGAHAVDTHLGVMAPTYEKASIKQKMIRAAKETWLVADSSKFEERAFTRVCQLNELTGIVTDHQLAPMLRQELSEVVQVLITETEGN